MIPIVLGAMALGSALAKALTEAPARNARARHLYGTERVSVVRLACTPGTAQALTRGGPHAATALRAGLVHATFIEGTARE